MPPCFPSGGSVLNGYQVVQVSFIPIKHQEIYFLLFFLSILASDGQLSDPRPNVFLLWSRRARSPGRSIPVVEKIPDHLTIGNFLQTFSKFILCNAITVI